MAINRAQTARSTSRRNSFQGLVVSLQLDELGRFVKNTVRQLSEDPELIEMVTSEYNSIADKARNVGVHLHPHHNQQNGLEHCRDELDNLVHAISAFLSSESKLPSNVIYTAHSLTGNIQETLGRHNHAIQSFLKALWIATSCTNIPREQLAVTLHRLGKSYAAVSGNDQLARALAQKAVTNYELANIQPDHPCLVEARQLCVRLEQQISSRDVAWSSLPSSGFRRLSLIREVDSETSERRLSI